MPIYLLLTSTAFEPAEVEAMAQGFEAICLPPQKERRTSASW
jgi:hypothetical protein